MQPLPVSQAGVLGQVEPEPHELCAVQSTSHAHALPQVTMPSHESGPQVMSHLPGPHAIVEEHAWLPPQLRVHTPVALHAIGASQES